VNKDVYITKHWYRIGKTVNLSEKDFLLRMFYKDCYWHAGMSVN